MVVQLAENRATISSLLTFVFPVIPILPPTIEQILQLLSVAEKYEMATVLIRIRDFASRRDPPLICRQTALKVYSLARKNGLLRETLEAAEETLKYPMTTIQDIESEDELQLDMITGVALYELWQYRRRVLENLDTNISERSELCQILFNTDRDCEKTSEDSDIPLWLDEYIDTVLEDPASVDLTTFHVSLSSHVSLANSNRGCKRCTSISSKTIREFRTALVAAVHESTRKVSVTYYPGCGCDKSQLVHRLNYISHLQRGKSTFKFLPLQQRMRHRLALTCKEQMSYFNRLTLFPSAFTSQSWP